MRKEPHPRTENDIVDLRRLLRRLADPAEKQTLLLQVTIKDGSAARGLAADVQRNGITSRRLVERELLTEKAGEAIQAVDTFVQRMSLVPENDLWTTGALAARPEWLELRRRAQAALDELPPMPFTAARLGRTLLFELEKGCDILRLSRWAYAEYVDHALELEPEAYDAMQTLIAMEAGPEFALTEKDLRLLAARLLES